MSTISETVGWFASLLPAEQLEQLSGQELSAILAERVFGWKVWRNEHTGAWLALEHERQNPQTPSVVLDWASHDQHCLAMLQRKVFGQKELILVHEPGCGYRCRIDNQLIDWQPSWPKAVVRAMLVGYTDDLQSSCLSYLFDPEHFYKPTRAGTPNNPD